MKMNDFSCDLAFSNSHSGDDEDVLARLFPSLISCRCQLELDKRGADYFCTNASTNTIVLVDVKRRRAGARRYWQSSAPEVPIELADNGWLFKPRSVADFIVFIFDHDDSKYDYAVDADDLRRAATENRENWLGRFGAKRQRNQRDGRAYDSGDVLFIPVSELEVAGVSVIKIPKE